MSTAANTVWEIARLYVRPHRGIPLWLRQRPFLACVNKPFRKNDAVQVGSVAISQVSGVRNSAVANGHLLKQDVGCLEVRAIVQTPQCSHHARMQEMLLESQLC